MSKRDRTPRTARPLPSSDAPPSATAAGGAPISVLALAVFAVSLVTWLLTLAPTVTGEDSGELVAAAYTLGIPHPPGYPLWCLVTRVFMLLPIGDMAWRANFGSAFAAAAACALTVPLLARLGVRPLVAAASTLLLTASATLWAQAVIAEVYGLSLLLLVGLLYCLVAWRQTVDKPAGDNWMTAAAFLTTLSLGAHQTVVLASPLILLWVVWVGRERLLTPVRLARIAIALVAGLSVQLYLPLRAAAKPAMNWGCPDTLERFWAHVTRQQYPSLMGATHTLAGTLGQWKVVGGYLLSQWPWPITLVVIAVTLVGVAACFRRDRFLAVWLVLWLAIMSLGFSWLLNFALDQEGVHIAEVFFIPAWFAVVVAFAWGAEALAARVGTGATAGLTVALVAVALGVNGPALTMRGNDVALRYGRDMLATVPPGAILFTSADYEAFPIQYLQIVEGQRPDVTALDEERDIDRALQAAGLAPATSGKPDESDVARLVRESRVPIYATRAFAPVPGTVTLPVGLLQRIFPTSAEAADAPALDEKAWAAYAPLPDGPWRADWSTASMLAAYDIAKARSALAYGRGDVDVSVLIARAASRLPGDPVLMNSLGAMLASAKRPADAIAYYDRAIAMRPDYLEANVNKIAALMALGRWPQAQEAYASAVRAGVRFGEVAPQIEDALMQGLQSGGGGRP